MMKVLIAEDSRSARMILAATLRDWGYEVVETTDGDAALSALAAPDIALAILDWEMPGLTGLEVCERLRELDRFVYAVILTGTGDVSHVAHALERGASDYVIKPFEPSQLRARLQVGERILALQNRLVQTHKLESIGRLAGGIAHELNTPLQYVGSNLEFLDEALAAARAMVEGLAREGQGEAFDRLAAEVDWGYMSGEAPAALAQARDGLARVAHIVSAMKQFATEGNGEASDEDLNVVVSNAVTLGASSWRDVAEVSLDLSADLPAVPCVPAELCQVVTELLVNAAHAIRDRGSRSGEPGRITVSTLVGGEGVSIAVADDGVGMEAEVSRRAFDPFFTTRDVGQGSGQGLAVAHGIVVDRHRGRLECTSTPGVGSTFRIWLPSARSRADAA